MVELLNDPQAEREQRAGSALHALLKLGCLSVEIVRVQIGVTIVRAVTGCGCVMSRADRFPYAALEKTLVAANEHTHER